MNVSVTGLEGCFGTVETSEGPCLPDATVSWENSSVSNPNGTDETSPEGLCLTVGSFSLERYSPRMFRQPRNPALRISESNSNSSTEVDFVLPVMNVVTEMNEPKEFGTKCLEDLHEGVLPAGNVAEGTANLVHNVKKFNWKRAKTPSFKDWVQGKTHILGTRSKIEQVNLEIAQFEKCCVQQKLKLGDILCLQKGKLLSELK